MAGMKDVMELLEKVDKKLDYLLTAKHQWAICTSCKGRGYNSEVNSGGRVTRSPCQRCGQSGKVKFGTITDET